MSRRSCRQRLFVGAIVVFVGGPWQMLAQEPAAPQSISAVELKSAIDHLGDLDYASRVMASRTVRRTPPEQAVPALLQAVADHPDGYVRYRALVLLVGFNDPRTKTAMLESLTSPNDRLRTVAYGFFEHNPDPMLANRLIAALETESAEFVRPALVRALAAMSGASEVGAALVREVGRGEDFFRSAVIEALGDYKAVYAVDALTAIAKAEGPLADDAALALGKIGDKRSLDTLVELQRSGPVASQPTAAAALCLIGVDCAAREEYLGRTVGFASQNPGFQAVLRSATAGLAALGTAGRGTATTVLFDAGIASQDPTRARVSIALATIALRNAPLMLSALEQQPRQAEAIVLLAEGFDMLEEDLEKERFFALVRRTYWAAAEGSPTRELMRTLIGKLDF
jgi:HEAT repeat protein